MDLIAKRINQIEAIAILSGEIRASKLENDKFKMNRLNECADFNGNTTGRIPCESNKRDVVNDNNNQRDKNSYPLTILNQPFDNIVVLPLFGFSLYDYIKKCQRISLRSLVVPIIDFYFIKSI